MTKSSNERPIILVTNDDGVTAPGIRNLVESVQDLGKVVVVAPDKPQSGMGHELPSECPCGCILSPCLKALRHGSVQAPRLTA